jgi:hypothetical protein
VGTKVGIIGGEKLDQWLCMLMSVYSPASVGVLLATCPRQSCRENMPGEQARQNPWCYIMDFPPLDSMSLLELDLLFLLGFRAWGSHGSVMMLSSCAATPPSIRQRQESVGAAGRHRGQGLMAVVKQWGCTRGMIMRGVGSGWISLLQRRRSASYRRCVK